MSINFGELGSFNKILDLYLKENGGYVEVEEVYYKEEGSWVKVYPGEEVGGGGKTVDPLILWSLRENKSGTDDLTDAARPMNLQAAFVSNGVDLSWEVFNPDIVEKYEIHRADDPEGSYSKVGESTSKQFVDTSIPEGEYKFYKARSVLKSNGSFSEFSKPEYGHLVNIDINSTDISYSSPALTTVEGTVTSFGQAELALPAARWKKSSASNYQEKESGSPEANGSGSISVDLKVKYSSAPTSSVHIDSPEVNDGNDPNSFDKIVSNGSYIVTKTEQAVRLWDLSYNLKDTITYPDETSDSGSNVIEDVAIRNDGYIGTAKRNDAGDSNAVEVYEIDNNENLTFVFGSSNPGGSSDSNFGYSVTFNQANKQMAVGNVNGEIFYYDSTFNQIEKRDYSFTSSTNNLDAFYRLGYREFDGSLYALRRQFSTTDSLLVVNSARDVVEEALGSTIAVADWNNFDGPNAGYLVGMDKANEKFHVWDNSLAKVGEYEVDPNAYSDRYPTSVHWRPDGGLLFTFDNAGFSAIHDSGFNLMQKTFRQNKADGSTNSVPLTDGLVLPNNKLFVSYDFDASDSPMVNSDLRMLSSYDTGSELVYETDYDVTLGLKNDDTFYPASTNNSFNTNIPSESDTPPGDVTFESFEVTSNSGDGEINLSWTVNKITVPDSYNIYRADTQNGSFAQVASVTNKTSYKDFPQGFGSFFYYVRIVKNGTEYNQSSTKSAELDPTNKMYYLDRQGAFDPYARQFQLQKVWDLGEGITEENVNLDRAIGAGDSSKSLVSAQSFSFKSDGSELYLLRDSETNSAGVWQLGLTDPYNISSSDPNATPDFFDMQNEVSYPLGMHFKPDGTRVYVSGENTMDIYEYQLGTPWDITTTSFVQKATLDDPNQSGESITSEIEFKPDGTELFVTLDSNELAKFTLSTPWGVTTASFQNKTQISNGVGGIYFSEDGSRFYTQTADGLVTENIMKTRWDVTSRIEMNSSEHIDSGEEEQVDLYFQPPEGQYNVPRNIQTANDINNGEITLSWNTSDPNINHYNVYKANNSGGNFSKINSSNVADVYFTDSNVSEGERYFYKIASVDGSGNEIGLSSEVSVAFANVFKVSSGETKTLTDVTKDAFGVQVNGTLNIEGKVVFNIESFFEVGSNGTVNGSEKGFGPGSGEHADGNGPGGGFGQGNDGGVGASYGGQGGSAQDALSTPPATYGDPSTAGVYKGSAGANGDGNSLGGSGGAALEVLEKSGSFSTTIDGTLNFDGQDGQHDGSSTRAGGGGSGGGVYIESNVTGSGSITAKGGDGTSHSNDGGGAGGGGRLKAYSFGSNITTDVSGGIIPSGGDGEPGNSGSVTEASF